MGSRETNDAGAGTIYLAEIPTIGAPAFLYRGDHERGKKGVGEGGNQRNKER